MGLTQTPLERPTPPDSFLTPIPSRLDNSLTPTHSLLNERDGQNLDPVIRRGLKPESEYDLDIRPRCQTVDV